MRTYTSDTVVNGWRIRNTADGFQPRDGENWTLVNNYYEYIRDDCVENDDRLGRGIYDSLFDGCYTGLSEQDAGSTAGETLILDGVLMRLQPMPGPYSTNDPTILGHGSFFKKFDDGGRAPADHPQLSVRRREVPRRRPKGLAVRYDDEQRCDRRLGGTGDIPMSTLPGMTLTTNRSVWDNARADWLSRHGCTASDQLGGAVRPKCLALAKPVAYAVAYGLALAKPVADGLAYGLSLTLRHGRGGCRRDRACVKRQTSRGSRSSGYPSGLRPTRHHVNGSRRSTRISVDHIARLDCPCPIGRRTGASPSRRAAG